MQIKRTSQQNLGATKYYNVVFSIVYPYFRNGVFSNLKYILYPMD
jgi:hypothetical protein